MPVKPAVGETVEETKRTRIIPSIPEASSDSGEKQDIWDVVDTLKAIQPNLEKPEYEFTIYRGRKAQRADEKEWIGKFYEPMKRERIQRDFGGGEYNIWLKMGPGLQLRYNVDLKIAGDPISSSSARSTTGNGTLPAGDANSQIIAMLREEMRALRDEMKAARGGDLTNEAMRNALSLNGQVFSTALPAAMTAIQGVTGKHDAGPMDGLMQQFMQAMVTKMMNPVDPIESFLKMATAMNGIGFKMGGGGGSEKLFDKLAVGIVNQLPALGAHVAGIMDGYRRAEEAKANAVALSRGVVLPPPQLPAPRPVAVAAPAPNNVVEMPAPAPPAQGTAEQIAQGEQMLQAIETKIVEVFNDTSLRAEDAATQILAFIDVMDPVSAHPDKKNLTDQILEYGLRGLDYVFNSRPILQQIPKGARLDEFKSAFLANGRSVSVPENAQPNPNIPPA